MNRWLKIHLHGDYIYVGSFLEGIVFMDKLVPVASTGYGSNAQYVHAKNSEDAEFELIKDSQFSTSKERVLEYMQKKVEEAEASRSRAWAEINETDKKVKAHEEELNALRLDRKDDQEDS